MPLGHETQTRAQPRPAKHGKGVTRAATPPAPAATGMCGGVGLQWVGPQVMGTVSRQPGTATLPAGPQSLHIINDTFDW